MSGMKIGEGSYHLMHLFGDKCGEKSRCDGIRNHDDKLKMSVNKIRGRSVCMLPEEKAQVGGVQTVYQWRAHGGKAIRH